MEMPELTDVRLRLDERGVATVTLARPHVRNALGADLLRDLQRVIAWSQREPRLRAVVLTGEGDAFCAGADMHWMQEAMRKTREQRLEEGAAFRDVLQGLNELHVPLIGRINGASFGGGAGMVAVCDIAIASRKAMFRLSETRIGLVPANIAPYVVARMGEPNARRVSLNAKLMTADTALRYGLVSAVADPDTLDAAVEDEIEDLLACAPQAVAATKKLIRFVHANDLPTGAAYSLQALADAWETDTARQGISAFLAKRRPPWASGQKRG